MELENILSDFLEEKNQKKSLNETFITIKGIDTNNINNQSEIDYEDDELEDDSEYEDDYDEDEDEDEDENEDYEDIDINKIDDIEKIKIALSILNHVNVHYSGLTRAITNLVDIIEDNDES